MGSVAYIYCCGGSDVACVADVSYTSRRSCLYDGAAAAASERCRTVDVAAVSSSKDLVVGIITADLVSSVADRRSTCPLPSADCTVTVSLSVGGSPGVFNTVLYHSWTNDVCSAAARLSTGPVCPGHASQPHVCCWQRFRSFNSVHGA